MTKLTELGLKSFAGKGRGATISEEGGLRGEVRSSEETGTVSFSYRYRFQGKVRELRCGTWPNQTLKEIRSVRDSAKALLSKGVDPGLARQQERAGQVKVHDETVSALRAVSMRPRVRDLFEEWHRREASKRAGDGQEIRRAFNKDVLPEIGDAFADEVKRRHLIAILDSVKERGSYRFANVLLQYLRQMFRFAAIREIVPGDPTFGILKKDVGGKDGIRVRHLTEKEIRELAAKLPKSGLTTGATTAIWIMLATCCRIGELSRARWSDVDLTAGTWTIPVEHSKNGRAHVIHLSEFAMRQFEVLRANSADEVAVFPNRSSDGHLGVKSLQKQFYDRQRTVPLKGRSKKVDTLSLSGGEWRAHDLRRTAATLMGELGVRSDVIERCLNHVGEDKLRKIYQLQELIAERIEAFRRLGERLEILASRKDNVVAGDFRRKGGGGSGLADMLAAVSP